MPVMNSSRPYLLRAIYDWIVDNQLTPYLLVNAELPDVQVPREYVNNGKIMLNIAPQAVQGLSMSGDELSFNARFSGKPTFVSLPMSAALAIYARENGRGMVFNDEDDTPPDTTQDQGAGQGHGKDKAGPKGKRGPKLRVIK
jgi:stringent starvation protein B